MKTIEVNFNGVYKAEMCIADDIFNAIYNKGKMDVIRSVKANIDKLYCDDFLKTLTSRQIGFNEGLEAVVSMLNELEKPDEREGDND